MVKSEMFYGEQEDRTLVTRDSIADCSQSIVNLYLTGRAVKDTIDNELDLDGFILRGKTLFRKAEVD